MRVIFLGIVFIFSAWCPSAPAQVLDTLPFKNSREKRLYRVCVNRLKHTDLNIDWKDISFRNAIADLRRQTRLNFIVTREADEKEIENLTLRLRNVSGRLLLHFLSESGDVVFQFRRGAVFVTSKSDAIKRASVLQFYSVHDLLYVPPDFPAPRIGINPLPPGEREQEEVEERDGHDPERIIEIIKMATGESNWEYGFTSIQIHKGRMIVRHTPAMQRRVRNMIAALGAI